MSDIGDHFTYHRMILRTMSWERAKGELQAMLNTYSGQQEQYNILNKCVKEFISHVDDNGLADL